MSLNEEFGQINFDPTEEAEQRYNASAEEEKRKAALTAEEEAKKEEQEAQVAAKEAEQAKEDGKHLGDRVLDTPGLGQLASVGAGVIDTAFDVAGL